MSDGPWISIGDEWLNLGEAHDVEIAEDEDSESYTLTITWSIDHSENYTIDDESKRDEIAETLDDLLQPEQLDLEPADVEVSFL